MMKRLLLYSLLAWGITATACAQPYIPSSDDTELERLPIQADRRNEMKKLKMLAADHPGDLDSALILAKSYIEQGRADSDPRYYGRAEAVISAFTVGEHPVAAALTLRATLYQSRHEFDKALADLSRALAIQPRQSQAWLTRAVILEVQGDYPGAIQSCRPLLRLASDLLATACLQSALSLSGQAEYAYQGLLQTLSHAKNADAEEKQWVWVTLAEMAQRLNKTAEAEQHYQAALASAPSNGYLLASYADFLLDQGLGREVVELLSQRTRADNLLLRLTLAESSLKSEDFAEHLRMLEERFAAARQRGDNSHQGDEARFRLYLGNDPATALKLARSNWTVQRESRDARILMEAALAANTPEAAGPVLEFLSRTHLQDASLEILAARLGQAS